MMALAHARVHDRITSAITTRSRGRCMVPSTRQDKQDGSSVTIADQRASAHALALLNAPHAGPRGHLGGRTHLIPAPMPSGSGRSIRSMAPRRSARGLPVWGVGVGLLKGPEPVAGYLHFPVVGETYIWENGVATRNGQPLRLPASRIADDTRNIMITAIHDYVDVRRVRDHRLHNLGSNLYHLMTLATGRCEAIITGPCYLWDMGAPALPITAGAGPYRALSRRIAFRCRRTAAARLRLPDPPTADRRATGAGRPTG